MKEIKTIAPVTLEVGVEHRNENGVVNSQISEMNNRTSSVDDSTEGKLVDMKAIQASLSDVMRMDAHDVLEPGHLKELASAINAGYTPQLKVLLKYSDLKKAGFKFAFDTQNRNIYESQVKTLYEDVKGRSGHCFSEPGKVVPAAVLLKERKALTDCAGNPITATTPDLDKYLVVLDSQHRVMVCMLHPEVDLYLEFVDLTGVTSNEYYVVLNNFRKNHTGSDAYHTIIEANPTKVGLLEEMVKFKAAFGVTDKYAEAALTGKVDKFKKAELREFQSGEKTVDSQFDLDTYKAGVAWDMLDVIKFKYSSNADLLKYFKRYQFPKAVWNVYDGLSNEKQKEFKEDICCFLAYADKIKNVMSKVGDSTFNSTLTKAYNTYQEKVTMEEKTAHKREVKKMIETSQSARNAQSKPNPNSPVKSLKSGSFPSVFNNMKELMKAAEEKEAKKAKSKAVSDPASKHAEDATAPTVQKPMSVEDNH